MDRIEGMTMLLRAIELGSFSAAARELRVPVQTVSRKIAELEAHLGAQLLTRTTRRLALTDAGESYAAAAKRIVEQVEDAEREVAGEFVAPRGDLVITAPLLFGRLHVLPIVSDFLAQFPDINIRLVLGDWNLNLLDAQIDMAVRIAHLPDSGMIATRVGTMRGVVCASPALLARLGAPRTPVELQGLPCISPEGPASTAAWRFRDALKGLVFEVPIAPRLITSAAASIDAAIRGTGFTRLLHYQAFEAIEAGELEVVLEAYELDPFPVHLMHASRGQMPLKLRRFLDFAAPRLREALAVIASQARS
ncbi:LysR family transcriptional regulator [Burkholderia sp. Cy-637]|uniref:LysR family transcriptional regulator n=1 Tax=Burkholderia sp. Cy-637 TaxID=2608327 RepID=UPI001420857D|nr:LysR family transcriptional regulator [Burkholderia sp. Cy-637]NIF87807.1 LysR family transcriptional regulator [Burkholderia sp. Cy-637]